MDIEENKIRHLEMIQKVVDRMAGNLFLLKGWSVTLVAALFALLASKDTNPRFIFIALIPIIIFWLLDGYFLSQERKYRALYKEVTGKSPEQIDFLMTTKKFKKGKNTWVRSIFSTTLIIFYGLLLVLLAILIYFNYNRQINNHLKNIWRSDQITATSTPNTK